MGRKKGNRRQDHWGKRAKTEGYGARSVYKLEEIHRRFRVLPRRGGIVDLGCCPGSWSQFVRQRCGKGVRLVGVDNQGVENYPGVFLHASVFEVTPEALKESLGGGAKLVLSDMAPFTTGVRFTDHVRQLELAEQALALAVGCLQADGDFVVKVFDGEDAQAFVAKARQHFTKVRRVKPEATRNESVEFFLVCKGFKNPPPSTGTETEAV